MTSFNEIFWRKNEKNVFNKNLTNLLKNKIFFDMFYPSLETGNPPVERVLPPFDNIVNDDGAPQHPDGNENAVVAPQPPDGNAVASQSLDDTSFKRGRSKQSSGDKSSKKRSRTMDPQYTLRKSSRHISGSSELTTTERRKWLDEQGKRTKKIRGNKTTKSKK